METNFGFSTTALAMAMSRWRLEPIFCTAHCWVMGIIKCVGEDKRVLNEVVIEEEGVEVWEGEVL